MGARRTRSQSEKGEIALSDNKEERKQEIQELHHRIDELRSENRKLREQLSVLMEDWQNELKLNTNLVEALETQSIQLEHYEERIDRAAESLRNLLSAIGLKDHLQAPANPLKKLAEWKFVE